MFVEAEFGVSKRGNPMIKIGDFTFYRQRAQGEKVRWWCQAASKGCTAALYTVNDDIVKRVGAHNHIANNLRIHYRAREDLVQCVPTRKGHQILYKGYTYVFKTRLQCGAEQWCCSYRQKTGCISIINMQAFGVEVVRDFHNHIKPVVTEEIEELPEWVSIYFLKKGKCFRCNICDSDIETTKKSLELLDHIKTSHAEVLELHKNPDSSVGFRIEFLQFNVLNEDDDGDVNSQPVILGEVCEGPTEGVVVGDNVKTVPATDTSSVQYVLIPKKKKIKTKCAESRKRSWVWKYFDKLSTIIFRCNICNVVLSIKGCNTNNMNRHIRTRHPVIYQDEISRKSELESALDLGCEVEPPYAVKTEEIPASEKERETPLVEGQERKAPRRSSWVWAYFRKLSGTQAQCRLCNRSISHGGNATGNMNRHIKMLHNELYTTTDENNVKMALADENGWVWKVFESDEDDFYSCKICQFKCMKFASLNKSVSCILKHLKLDHGVISGDQIITSVDCDTDE